MIVLRMIAAYPVGLMTFLSLSLPCAADPCPPGKFWNNMLKECQAQGGVYIQHDARRSLQPADRAAPANSNVRRTGLSNNIARRTRQHERKEETKNLNTIPVVWSNDPAVRRGVENRLYDANPQATRANGGLNKIRPPRMKPGDREAADRALSQIGGSSGRN